MNIVIGHRGLKREIDGPFSICLSRHDLQRIVDLLQEKSQRGFSYGWVEIYHLPTPTSRSNEKPIDWLSDGKNGGPPS